MPRSIIVRYLNYADRTEILQAFRSQRELKVNGYNLLLFADYSVEVSRKRKAFTKICSKLHNAQIRFTLAYPAVLKLTTPSGQQHTFVDPTEAKFFMEAMDQTDETIPATPTMTPQRRPPKPQRQYYSLMTRRVRKHR